MRGYTLNSNKIQIFPTELTSLISLEELNLNTNQLTEVPAEIQNLLNLKYLYIAENLTTEENKTKIKSWLPNTTIYS